MSPYLLILVYLPYVLARRGGSSIGRSSGTHYPTSHGLSGTSHVSHNAYSTNTQAHTYPLSPALSGSSNSRYAPKTEVHNHYHYSPPQQISYGSTYHPVFQGQPPVYVYEYRNSGSRFDNLLTGLALYNLGRMSSQPHHSYDHNQQHYRRDPGETCKFIISKDNGEYEETRIDCKLMSSFIWEAQNEQKTNIVSKTVVQNVVMEGNSTRTVKNTTIVDALEVKGPSISIKPGMKCFMVRISRNSQIKKNVDCGLLQEYAVRSLQYNGSAQVSPMVPILTLFIIGSFYMNRLNF